MNPSSPAPSPLREVGNEEAAPWLALLRERFGIPSQAFSGLRFLLRKESLLFIVAADHLPPARPAPAATGLAFLHVGLRHPKLTTSAAVAFGNWATRNVVDLGRSETDLYLQRRPNDLAPERLEVCTGDGFVLPRHDGRVLGVGFLHRSEIGGTLESLYPKALRLAEGGSAFGDGRA